MTTPFFQSGNIFVVCVLKKKLLLPVRSDNFSKFSYATFVFCSSVTEELETLSVLKFIEQIRLGWWGHQQIMKSEIPVVGEARIQAKTGRGRQTEL